MSRVLLVDDERNVLDALLRLLKMMKLPCEGETASTADDALALVRAGGIDVVVSDVHMPNGDGMNLLQQIRTEPASCHIPVIMLTGSLEPETKRRALELGATDFINKPVDPGEFAARLRGVIQLKAYEDQLREQNRVLEQQVVQLQRMENLGFLAGGIVHDLNNTLAGVMGHAQMVLVNLRDESHVRRHIEQALEASEQATQLVRQVLTIGRRSTEERSDHDISELIDRGLGLLSVTIPDQVELSWTRPARPIVSVVEPGEIHQVLMNLCINGVHAINGAGRLTVELSQATVEAAEIPSRADCAPGTYARLVISDSGCGIDEAVKARIFEPLFTTKPVGRGTGLGLSVVQRIVDAHRGFITVDSAVGQGTTFRVYLPLSARGVRGPQHAVPESPVLSDNSGA